MFSQINNYQIEPIDKKAITLVFSFDNNFAKYFSVALKSLEINSKPDEKYDIIVFYSNLSEYNQSLLKQELKNNFYLRFINVNLFMDIDIVRKKFKVSNWWSIETYYRLFIPFIMRKYKRILYCDTDIIFNENIYEFFNLNFDDNEIISIRDVGLNHFEKQRRLNYVHKHLGLKIFDNYFNAGVILYNIPIIDRDIYRQRCLSAFSIKNLQYLDQDILNIIFEGKVKYVSMKYNFTTGAINNKNHLKDMYKKDFEESSNNPVIIHYTNVHKPWECPNVEYAYYFWKYARLSPFYEEIIFTNLNNNFRTLHFSKNIIFNFWLYKLLSFITVGRLRKYFIDKKTKEKIKNNKLKRINKK